MKSSKSLLPTHKSLYDNTLFGVAKLINELKGFCANVKEDRVTVSLSKFMEKEIALDFIKALFAGRGFSVTLNDSMIEIK